MKQRYYSDIEISKYTGISVSKLRSDRQKNQGLPFYKIDGTVRYDIDEVDKHIMKRKIIPKY